MANKKTDVSVLVRGLGMGMAFLQALTEEIVAAGGFEEMIHFLTKKHARPICRKIAEVIVASEWKIPRSLMERLAPEAGETSSAYVENDKRYAWGRVLPLFGVPVTKFGNPQYFPNDAGPVPKALIDQIVDKPLPYPLIVQWEGEPHIVVSAAVNGEEFSEGKVVPSNEVFEQLSIAPTKYFNLDQ